MRLRLFVLAFSLFFTSFALASTPQTFLTLISQPGDYIGGGTTETFTPADGTFSVSNTSDTVSISFNTPSFSQFWYLDFGTPTSMKALPARHFVRRPARVWMYPAMAAAATPILAAFL